MAIHRGIQSAIFYYLSCAPCAEARYRKKRKQDAARTRAERELMQEEHPDLYRHPSPSSTNPHWQTEIAMGPTLTSRGKRKTNTADSQRGLRPGRVSSNASGEPSMVDLPSSSDRNESLRIYRSYQREDEELWGSTSNLDGSLHNLSIPQRALTRESHSSDYRTYRNPPINDLHPATFTKVHSREDVMWMMQPPPVAEVMSGKQRPPRSRSDSGGSCLSPTSSTMSRQVSNRPMAAPMSRESSSRTSNGPFGQRSPTTSERDFAISPVLLPQKDIPLSPMQNLNESEDSTTTVIRRPSLAAEPLRRPPANRVASRPQLSTIASDSSIPAADLQSTLVDKAERPKENSAPDATQSSDDSSGYVDPYARRSAVLLREGPLEAMHDIGPKGIRGKVFRTTTDITEAAHRLPGHRHEESEDAVVAMRPELFDSWYTPDFELPKWIHEHTKREVRERWSMDF